MDPYYGDVEEILQIHDSRRIPLSVQYRDKRMKEKKAFQEWINYRNIPKTRALAGSVFKNTDIRINSLSLKSLGLNLNDQYWFKPYGSLMQLVSTSISKKNSLSFHKKTHNYNYKGYPASCRIAFSITSGPHHNISAKLHTSDLSPSSAGHTSDIRAPSSDRYHSPA